MGCCFLKVFVVSVNSFIIIMCFISDEIFCHNVSPGSVFQYSSADHFVGIVNSRNILFIDQIFNKTWMYLHKTNLFSRIARITYMATETFYLFYPRPSLLEGVLKEWQFFLKFFQTGDWLQWF